MRTLFAAVVVCVLTLSAESAFAQLQPTAGSEVIGDKVSSGQFLWDLTSRDIIWRSCRTSCNHNSKCLGWTARLDVPGASQGTMDCTLYGRVKGLQSTAAQGVWAGLKPTSAAAVGVAKGQQRENRVEANTDRTGHTLLSPTEGRVVLVHNWGGPWNQAWYCEYLCNTDFYGSGCKAWTHYPARETFKFVRSLNTPDAVSGCALMNIMLPGEVHEGATSGLRTAP